MITVRFATGFSIQYNDAYYVSRSTSYSDLLTSKGGTWVAQVPNDCVIEFVRPCRIYNANTVDDLAGQFLAELQDDVRRRTMSTYTAKRIKRLLSDHFDALRQAWK